MVLARQFKDTVQTRVQRDAPFRHTQLAEAVNELLTGDFSAGKALLRDYINATLGIQALGEPLPKSLRRMLGPTGNPTAATLLAVLNVLQEHAAVGMRVRLQRSGAQSGE